MPTDAGCPPTWASPGTPGSREDKGNDRNEFVEAPRTLSGPECGSRFDPHCPSAAQSQIRVALSTVSLVWGLSVTSVADCTVPEKILLAAHQLEAEGQSPFSAEALIVASWQKFPKTFGLKGYTDQYPDSNKVLSSIMGVKGLANRGWLVKMGQKLYTISREGRQTVQRIQAGGEPDVIQGPVRFTREQEKFLQRLFETSALEKFNEGRKSELTFGDACRFWEIGEAMGAEAINGRLGKLRLQLTEMERQLQGSDAELSNGRSVAVDDLAHLLQVHQYLEERFSRHLNLLRTRAER